MYLMGEQADGNLHYPMYNKLLRISFAYKNAVWVGHYFVLA
jgi:hypothetical protein